MAEPEDWGRGLGAQVPHSNILKNISYHTKFQNKKCQFRDSFSGDQTARRCYLKPSESLLGPKIFFYAPRQPMVALRLDSTRDLNVQSSTNVLPDELIRPHRSVLEDKFRTKCVFFFTKKCKSGKLLWSLESAISGDLGCFKISNFLRTLRANPRWRSA